MYDDRRLLWFHCVVWLVGLPYTYVLVGALGAVGFLPAVHNQSLAKVLAMRDGFGQS